MISRLVWDLAWLGVDMLFGVIVFRWGWWEGRRAMWAEAKRANESYERMLGDFRCEKCGAIKVPTKDSGE